MPSETFTSSSQLEELQDDLITNCLAKLQDGVKVTSLEAAAALKQYRNILGEMGRLQTVINRPSVRFERVVLSIEHTCKLCNQL